MTDGPNVPPKPRKRSLRNKLVTTALAVTAAVTGAAQAGQIPVPPTAAPWVSLAGMIGTILINNLVRK